MTQAVGTMPPHGGWEHSSHLEKCGPLQPKPVYWEAVMACGAAGSSGAAAQSVGAQGGEALSWEVGLHQILGNERGGFHKALWRCAAVVRLKAYVVVPPAPENTPAVTNV